MASRRWFHSTIDGIDAEHLLSERGMDGSFLVRPSRNTPGDFTLSVRRNNRVTHIKIRNSGDCYDLYGGEQFATLSELVQYYMETPGQLKEKNGEIITLEYPLTASDPTNERWFHGGLSGQDAEKLLLDQGRNGSFLVRESKSSPGEYALSVRTDDPKIPVTHVIIKNNNNKYDVGGGDSFDSLSELIEHYRRNSMVVVSGTVVNLKAPMNTTRIRPKGLAERVKNLGKSGFKEEFEALQQLECRHMFSRREGQKPENRAKNRYKNILPFDHSRIVLKDVDPNVPGSDYINANLITMLPGYDEFTGLQKQYISSQGCLPNTIDDFWRMIWQENCRVIVMMTKEWERGKTKCVPYWPEPTGKTLSPTVTTEPGVGLFGLSKKDLRVEFLTKETLKDYTHRMFRMSKDGQSESRIIHHWQFLAWPDHDVPYEYGTFINFLEEVNRCQNDCATAGPIVVHCSAGIGRTGTYIAIDCILSQITKFRFECDLDIQRTVQMIRDQRSGMVQTVAQYTFVYMAVLDYIDSYMRRANCSARLGSAREYSNIEGKLWGDQTGSAPVTPPTPGSAQSFSTEMSRDDGENNYQNVEFPPVAMLRLDPPPIPKRLAKQKVDAN